MGPRSSIVLWLGLAMEREASVPRAPGSSATDSSAAAPVVRELLLTGNRRTRRTTFEGLLPRPLPASMPDTEVAELERRIRNLEIFDEVTVSRREGALAVAVREKWTLVPSFELSTGQEAIDTSVTVGLTESNVLGTAHALTLTAGFADRGPFVELELDQHDYAPRTWSHAAEIGYESAELRLGGGGEEPSAGGGALAIWQRHRLGAGYFALPGGDYQSALRFGAGPFLVHEWLRRKRITGDEAAPLDAPGGSSWGGFEVAFWVDRMSFDDLAPSGFSAFLELTPMLRLQAEGEAPRQRAEATLELDAAVGARGRYALLAQAVGGVVTAGDPNHSLMLGSQGGVRGLPDGLYYNRAQAHTNLEARAAWRFAPRWALQAVAFTDAALFQPFDEDGVVQPIEGAWSTGAGLRLVPTWLDSLLLRLDGARLWQPRGAWFLQLGTAQYF